MKKLSLIAALALGGLLACSTIGMAQDDSAKKDTNKGGKGRMSVEQRLEKMSTDLNLTDAQKPKVKAVLEDQQKKMQELRADTSLDQQARREKMTSIMEDTNKKIKEILTPEQQEKWTKMQDEMKQKRGGNKKKTDQ
jgi:periplasmic protein CpxP/Spy